MPLDACVEEMMGWIFWKWNIRERELDLPPPLPLAVRKRYPDLTKYFYKSIVLY
jgi:hypothetical protein